MKLLKWQEEYKERVICMTDMEIFELIVHNYSCPDWFVGRDEWKFECLYAEFLKIMGWEIKK